MADGGSGHRLAGEIKPDRNKEALVGRSKQNQVGICGNWLAGQIK